MEREGLTEQEAFARLRKASQISGKPLRVVAEALVATLAPRSARCESPATPGSRRCLPSGRHRGGRYSGCAERRAGAGVAGLRFLA